MSLQLFFKAIDFSHGSSRQIINIKKGKAKRLTVLNMKHKISYAILSLIVICSMLLGACSNNTSTTTATQTEQKMETVSEIATQFEYVEDETTSNEKSNEENNAQPTEKTAETTETVEETVPDNSKDTKGVSEKEDSVEDTDTSTVTLTGTYHYSEAKKVLSLVNEYRSKNGLEELTWDEELAEFAKIRAAEASICWAHTRPDGSQWYTVSSIVHGENLAKGFQTAEDAFDAWLNSDSHRENILTKEYHSTYVAFFDTTNGWFWAELFRF